MAKPAERSIGHLLVAAFAVTLASVPNYFGGGLAITLPCLVPMLLCIAWALPRLCLDFQLRSPAAVALLLYLALVALALLRGAGTFMDASRALALVAMFSTVALFAATLLASARTEKERTERLAAICLSPAVYVGASAIALQVLGQAALTTSSIAQGTKAEMLGFLGIESTRVLFPFALGVNFFGAVAAAGLVAAFVLWLRSALDWRIAALAAAVSLYGILATDARGPLLIAVLVGGLFVVMPRLRAFRGIPVVIVVAPVIVVTALGLLAHSDLLEFASREGSDASTGTGRLYIWGAVGDTLTQPSWQHLIGFGAYGQIESGTSAQYAFLAIGTASPEALPTHSFVLQTILDTGYLGLAVVLAAVGLAARRLERDARENNRGASAAGLASLATIFLCGTTESMPSYLAPDALAVALLVMGAAAGLPEVGSHDSRGGEAVTARRRPGLAAPPVQG